MSFDDSFPRISTPLENAFRAAFEICTSDCLAKKHEQLSAASNIEISVKDRKESFKNTETYIYSFFWSISKINIQSHFRFCTNSYTNAC